MLVRPRLLGTPAGWAAHGTHLLAPPPRPPPRRTFFRIWAFFILEFQLMAVLLSREVREVSQAQNAQAVVVGTYAVSASVVYISLKLVNPVGNQVIAAHNYAVPADENVRTLLAGR